MQGHIRQCTVGNGKEYSCVTLDIDQSFKLSSEFLLEMGIIVFCLVFFVVLGVKCKTLCMVGKPSPLSHIPQPCRFFCEELRDFCETLGSVPGM